MTQIIPPWENQAAEEFLESFSAYRSVLQSIRRTLQLEPKNNPHEIRAAACLVILLCREKLWPIKGGIDQLDEIVDLAVTRLTRIKQLFEQRSKINPELLSDPRFRQLLTSLDQEIRILEARLSDPKPQMTHEPPCTWGNFWVG